MAKIASKAVKVSAAIVCIWYMSSGTVMIDRTTVSFDSTISMLTIGGTAAMSAAGSVDPKERVEGRHADAGRRLELAQRHGGKSGAENLGEIGRGIEAEADDARRRRAEPQADVGAPRIEQEQLHEERACRGRSRQRPSAPSAAEARAAD